MYLSPQLSIYKTDVHFMESAFNKIDGKLAFLLAKRFAVN